MDSILQFPETVEQFQSAAERLSKRFPMYCEWCWAEGKRTHTGWGPKKGMTKICERHNASIQDEIRRRFA